MWRASLLGLTASVLAGCQPMSQASLSDLDQQAHEYVLLVLALGEHDADFVDAYHGPAQWRVEARHSGLSVAEIAGRAATLRGAVENQANQSDPTQARAVLLAKQLLAVQTRAEQLSGVQFSFDEEASRLYDIVPARLDQAYFDQLLAELDELLPGNGKLSERRNRYQSQFVIPAARLDAVFQAAIKECRRRTLEYIELPHNERFVVEYVNDKPWSGYNWFQGDAYSLIQVNTDLPIYIDRAIDLACHEGYPGHHVFNTLLERELVEQRGWMEFSVYPLFSPMSLIAEGSANYGIHMAFPESERERFESEVLFPLAGLDASQVAHYYRVERLAEKLNYASNEAARRYLDGEIDAAQARRWLEDYALMSPERAAQRLRFIERYRSYVINYNLGQDVVRSWVDREARSVPQRWAMFEQLLSSPVSASMLR